MPRENDFCNGSGSRESDRSLRCWLNDETSRTVGVSAPSAASFRRVSAAPGLLTSATGSVDPSTCLLGVMLRAEFPRDVVSAEVGSEVFGRPRSAAPSEPGRRGDAKARKAPMIPPDLLLPRDRDLLGPSRDGLLFSRLTLIVPD
jgi:hypothetical protein